MSVVMLIVGIGLLSLAWAGRFLAKRVPGREAAAVLSWSLFGGWIVVEAGLLLIGLPTVLRQLGVPALAAACERMLHGLAPGGPAAGWVASGTAVAIAIATAVGAARAHRGARSVWLEPGIGDHVDRGWYELVVVPADRPLAVSVAGRHCQVVVSTGLIDALEPDELDVVVAHEEAHLRHAHHRTLVALAGIDASLGLIPPVRLAARELRSALERWADEEAAGGVPARRAAIRAALLRLCGLPPIPAVAAFAGASTKQRIAALEHPLPRPSARLRMVTWCPTGALCALATTASLMWANEAGTMLAMAGMCH